MSAPAKPLGAARNDDAPEATHRSSTTIKIRHRALIVEPHRAQRAELMRSFSNTCFESVEADSFERALVLAQDIRPALVVSELRLGIHSGLELLRLIKGEFPQVRGALVTSYGSISSAIRALRSGADAYLLKPVGAKEILSAVDESNPPDSGATVDEAWLSLERMKWEYINRVVEQSSSLAQAARRLRLHARSLRRMLAKYPPCG